MKKEALVLMGGALLILTAIILMLVSVIFNSEIPPLFVSLTMIGGIALIIIHHTIAIDEN